MVNLILPMELHTHYNLEGFVPQIEDTLRQGLTLSSLEKHMKKHEPFTEVRHFCQHSVLHTNGNNTFVRVLRNYFEKDTKKLYRTPC